MPKIAAVVLLFNPTEEVLTNIKSYKNKIAHLYVVDNTEDGSLSSSINKKLLAVSHASLLHHSENIGIANAFNLALTEAKKDGYEWLMTMDQDSFFDQEVLSTYLQYFSQMNKKNIALVSPLHNPKFVNASLADPYVKCEAVLSSGNLVNVNAALNAGGYDERFFIDEVDHAFCFELQRDGYSIVQDQSVYLNHMLGKTFSKHGNIKLYPPLRIYYMLRNYLYLKQEYLSGFPEFFKKREGYLLKFFMKQLIFSKERVQHFNMMKRGYRDYKNRVYGKYNAK